MIYLVTHFWAWGLSAFAVGVATSLSGGKRPRRGSLAAWLVWFGLAFVAGLAVAYLQLLTGRPGLWLEIGLAFFLAFVVGAALGAVIAGRSLRDHEAWALGLVPLALLFLGAVTLSGRTLELDIERKAATAAEEVGGDPKALEIAGRDVFLPSGAPNRADVAERIARIPGVRRIASVSAAGSEEPVGAAESGAPPSPPAATPSPEPRREEPATVAKPAPQPSAADVAAPAPGNGAKPDAVLAALPQTGELDAAGCRAALSATLSKEPIDFRHGSASIRRVSTGTLEKVTLFLKRCPDAKVEARGFREAGEKDDLARQRAERVVDYLIRMGVDPGRLASWKGKDAAGEKRTVEFVIEPRG